MFLSIEGIDGSGKTTLSQKLAEILPDAVFLPRKSVAKDLSQELEGVLVTLRSALWPACDFREEPIGTLYWYFKLMAWYTAFESTVLRPALKAHQHVIVDGWIYRPLIKTAMRSQISYEELFTMAKHLTQPDLAFCLDVPVEDCWSRRQAFCFHEMGYWDGYHDSDPRRNFLEYQRVVQKQLLDLGLRYHWKRIPNFGQSPEATCRELVSFIK